MLWTLAQNIKINVLCWSRRLLDWRVILILSILQIWDLSMILIVVGEDLSLTVNSNIVWSYQRRWSNNLDHAYLWLSTRIHFLGLILSKDLMWPEKTTGMARLQTESGDRSIWYREVRSNDCSFDGKGWGWGISNANSAQGCVWTRTVAPDLLLKCCNLSFEFEGVMK